MASIRLKHRAGTARPPAPPTLSDLAAPGGSMFGLMDQYVGPDGGLLNQKPVGDLSPMAPGYAQTAMPTPQAPARLPGGGAPAQPPMPMLPPPPPRPSMLSWSDVAPDLIDLGQVGGLYAPSQGVMDSFNNQRTTTNDQVSRGRTEVNRTTQQGKDTVNKLPAEYERIFGGISQLLNNAGSSSDAAMAKYGQQGNSAQNLDPLNIVNEMTKGSYQAQVPLLQAGFDERATQQNGFLTQLASQLLGDIDARQTDYTAGLDSAKASALAQAIQGNTDISNQFSQFNASGRSDASRANQQADNAYAQGNYEYANNIVQQAIDNASNGIAPGMSLSDIAAMNRPKDANTQFDISSIASKIPVGNKEVSLPAAIQLRDSGWGEKDLSGGGIEAYQKVRDQLLQGGDPAQVLADAKKKYGTKYPRALNLAMLNGGGFSDQLSGLAFGG